MNGFIHPADTDGSAAAISFAQAWNEETKKEREDYRNWFADLRANDIAAAAGDDGHVNRRDSKVTLFQAPSQYGFIDSLYFGAPIALGSPKGHRLVTILHYEDEWLTMHRRLIGPPFGYYTFAFCQHDPNKEYWTIQDQVTSLDGAKYFIRDKTTGKSEEYIPPKRIF